MSPVQRTEIARLLFGPTTPQLQLMKCRLCLYCGHVFERTAHCAHKTLHAAFTGSTSCAECGLVPETIVDGEAIGLKVEPPSARRPAAEAGKSKRSVKRTKVELEDRVRELEAEVQRLREGWATVPTII